MAAGPASRSGVTFGRRRFDLGGEPLAGIYERVLAFRRLHGRPIEGKWSMGHARILTGGLSRSAMPDEPVQLDRRA